MAKTIDGQEAFAIANKYLGWGDRGAPLWFIGIEGTNEWNQSLLERYKTAKIDVEPWADNLPMVINGVSAYSAKIGRQVSREFREAKWDSWHQYRDSRLWKEGAGILHLNFWPLDRPRSTLWPDSFRTTFRFANYGEYRNAVIASDRFERIRKLWNQQKPRAVVCFGKTHGWSCAAEVFGLSNQFEDLDSGAIRLFPDKRVVLTPFFGQGMSDQRARVVAKVLSEWGVSIP